MKFKFYFVVYAFALVFAIITFHTTDLKHATSAENLKHRKELLTKKLAITALIGFFGYLCQRRNI